MSQPVAIKPAPKGFDQTSLMLMGAVARSLQIAGALESMLDISVRYSNERVAFEKKISKFQAVQHNLAKLAGEFGRGTCRRDLGGGYHRQLQPRSTTRYFSKRPPQKSAARKPPKRARDRPSGAWRDRLHHRAHPASL